MKSSQEFKVFYDNTLKAQITDLDQLRKIQIKHGSILLLVILLALCAGFLVFAATDFSNTVKFLLVIGVFILSVIMVVRSARELNKKDYKKEFKHKIIEPIIKFISSDLNYFPEKFISEQNFKNSRLFLTPINRYKGDDLVEGQIEKTFFHFSEVHAEEEINSKNGKSYRTIFHGLFFIADFNKSFEGSTVLLPNRLGNRFTFLRKAAGIIRREKFVKLEDPEFMKNFNCYSDDDIKARYILSPALMRRLNEFKSKNSKTPIYISFVDDHLYIGFFYRKNMFEPKYFRSLIDFELIASYFNDIKLVVDVVADLNLNNRIWTKE
jgi:hypothetical protein